MSDVRVGVDIGGTFTDIVVFKSDGSIGTRKVSSTADDYARGIARDVLEIRRLRMPAMYDLLYEKPRPLVKRYLRCEVPERLDREKLARRATFVLSRAHRAGLEEAGDDSLAVSGTRSASCTHRVPMLAVTRFGMTRESEYIVWSGSKRVIMAWASTGAGRVGFKYRANRSHDRDSRTAYSLAQVADRNLPSYCIKKDGLFMLYFANIFLMVPSFFNCLIT